MDFNSLVNAGLVLSLFTYIGYQLKSIPEFLLNWIRRKITFSLTVDERDELYVYIERWLSDKHSKNYRNVEASINPNRFSEINNQETHQEKAYNEDKLYIWQHSDEFIINYSGRRLLISKGREKLEGAKDLRNAFLNRFTITGFFAKSSTLKLMNEIIEFNQKFKLERIPNVYSNNEWGDWSYSGKISTKNFDNIFFEEKSKLIKDLDHFIKNGDWYNKRGVTYKRGYLLWGKPGNGKTATIQAMSRYLNRDIYYLSLKDIEKDSHLGRLFSNMSNESILIIEDIDATFNGRQSDNKSSISFSILLNCLDGLFSQSGIITVMTTNHPENLDSALIRSGRIDLKLEITNPRSEMVEQYLRNFYDDNSVNISDWYKDGHLPMVTIQDICLCNRNSLGDAIEAIKNNLNINKYENTKNSSREKVF